MSQNECSGFALPDTGTLIHYIMADVWRIIFPCIQDQIPREWLFIIP